MSVAIFAIMLFLLSFWVLGYFYQKNQANVSICERKFKEKINFFNRKIKALEKEKVIYQQKITALEEDLKKIQKKIESFEDKSQI